MARLSILICLTALCVNTFAAPASAAVEATPKLPTLTFLYSCNVTLGPALNVGTGPRGTRNVIPITGGTFSGPKLSGKIMDVGADWSLTDAKGTFNPDTRYQLQTDDGANIFITTNGPGQPDGTSHLRVVFETGSSTYWWLNNIVAVGILRLGGPGVAIDVFQLNSP